MTLPWELHGIACSGVWRRCGLLAPLHLIMSGVMIYSFNLSLMQPSCSSHHHRQHSVTTQDQKLFHSLPLASAYAALAEAGGADPRDPRLARQRARLDPKTKEPLFTISTRDFKGTLDYVLYTRDSLAPVGLLELPAEGELNAGAGGGPDGLLPNPNWSSDHIALMVEFQYTRH